MKKQIIKTKTVNKQLTQKEIEEQEYQIAYEKQAAIWIKKFNLDVY